MAEAYWFDTIGEGMAGGATQYAGGLGVEFVFEPFCGFGEGELYGEFADVELFPARQFEYEFGLSTAEVDCDGEYCMAYWWGQPNAPGLYSAYVAAHDQACADEGGSSVMDGEYVEAPAPGYEDFEVSLKHTAPGGGNGRQDHPVVTTDCYDFSLFPFLD
jgi:hypothetical protein